MPVKPLSFKGDRPKKRKRAPKDIEDVNSPAQKHLAAATATEEPADEDNNWVSADQLSDISGPVMLVLPTQPPTALSVDQLGKVFAQKIENIVEALAESAEPHDVRQVWVATRVVGSENEFTLKGHHGRYLGCDQYGICSATREAISREETFKFQPTEQKPGMFDVCTIREKFISVDGQDQSPEIRGDCEEAGDKTHIRIRMQARFKPQHKVEKAEKVRAKISRKELEEEVGRRLDEEEVKVLKRARREGNYHEAMLDLKVKGKHDKFA